MDTLTGYGIVYFGNDWFAENRTSSHHIAERLSKRVPVVYIESPGQRAPKANARDLRKVWHKVRGTVAPPQRLGAQLWHATIPQLPFRRNAALRAMNFHVAQMLCRRALRQMSAERLISWFVAPDAGALAGRLGEDLSVYYVTDNYAAFPGVDAATIAGMDEDLTARVDQVFVSSRTLLEAKRRLNPHTTHSPHGVDVDHFRRASDPNTPRPSAAVGLARPVIGFFGLIEAWIDLELVERVARHYSTGTVLMIGRIAANVAALERLPNVVFTGPQPYSVLPEWASTFDVAIIPYRQNQQVFNANPLKLREYLATGKPVVAVPTPEISEFSDVVRIGTGQDFVDLVGDAIANDSAAARQARLDRVSAMSWDARVADILTTVAARLGEVSQRWTA